MKTNLAGFTIVLLVLAIAIVLMTENGIYIAGAILFFVWTLSISIFFFYLGQNSFEKGHKMSLEAQRVNDEWDVRKTESSTRFAVELLKTVKSMNSGGDMSFAPLLDSDDNVTVDAETKYIGTGFDNE